MAKQTINVRTADPKEFVKQIIAWAQKGAVLKDNTFPRVKTFPLTAILEIDTDKGVEPAPGVMPLPLSEQLYTKDELETLDWDQFKTVCKSRGLSGRDRNLLTNKYLQETGQL